MYYQLLKLKLQTIAELATIEYYKQQDSQLNAGGITCTPACYIQILPTRWRNIGNNVKEANLNFNLIVITDSVLDDDQRIETTNALFGPDHATITKLVVKKLEGKSAYLSELPSYATLANTPEDRRYMNAISLTETTPDHRNKALIKTILTFTSYIKNWDYAPTYVPYEETITLNIENFEI